MVWVIVIEQVHVYLLEHLGCLKERLDCFEKISVFYFFLSTGISGKGFCILYFLTRILNSFVQSCSNENIKIEQYVIVFLSHSLILVTIMPYQWIFCWICKFLAVPWLGISFCARGLLCSFCCFYPWISKYRLTNHQQNF